MGAREPAEKSAKLHNILAVKAILSLLLKVMRNIYRQYTIVEFFVAYDKN